MEVSIDTFHLHRYPRLLLELLVLHLPEPIFPRKESLRVEDAGLVDRTQQAGLWQRSRDHHEALELEVVVVAGGAFVSSSWSRWMG